MKLANLTMHDQIQFVDRFRELGFDINPTPLLREVSGMEDAKAAACEALKAAKDQGAQGILLGGRTDVCVYAAILAAAGRFKVFVAETKRVRDESDRFVFELEGVTPIDLVCLVDEIYLQWGAMVQGIDRPPATYELPPDEQAMQYFRDRVAKRPLDKILRDRVEVDGLTYRARMNGEEIEIHVGDQVIGTLPAPKFEVLDATMLGSEAAYAVGRTATGYFWFAWGLFPGAMEGTIAEADWQRVVTGSGAIRVLPDPTIGTPHGKEGAISGHLNEVVGALHATMGVLAANFHEERETDMIDEVSKTHKRLEKALLGW